MYGTDFDLIENNGVGDSIIITMTTNDDNDDDNDNITAHNDSFERALSDIEIVLSAYPEETSFGCYSKSRSSSNDPIPNGITSPTTTKLPLHVTLHLSHDAYIILEWEYGYPETTPLQIFEYRDHNRNNNKERMEHTIHAIRTTANECYEDGIEAGLSCCSTAFDTWNQYDSTLTTTSQSSNECLFSKSGQVDNDPCKTTTRIVEDTLTSSMQSSPSLSISIVPTMYHWFSSNTMIQDRKSIFVGHVCYNINETNNTNNNIESNVQLAIQQLISSNKKLQRATHQMYAYRFNVATSTSTSNSTTTNENYNDDGENGSGIRILQILQLNQEINVLLVVTRWYGGIHLGSKRFAHIVSAAQTVLQEYYASLSQK